MMDTTSTAVGTGRGKQQVALRVCDFKERAMPHRAVDRTPHLVTVYLRYKVVLLGNHDQVLSQKSVDCA